jgi:hypothetical protein
VEGILGVVAATGTGTERTITLVVMLGVIIGLVAIVSYFAYNRPEALAGRRYHAQVDVEQMTAPLKADVQRLSEENERLVRRSKSLSDELEHVTSVRRQVLGILGAQSADISILAQRLVPTNDTGGRRIVASVLGGLVQEGIIEQDTMKPEGYYRIRKGTGTS